MEIPTITTPMDGYIVITEDTYYVNALDYWVDLSLTRNDAIAKQWSQIHRHILNVYDRYWYLNIAKTGRSFLKFILINQ